MLGQVNSADRFKLTAQVDEFYLGRVAVGQEALFTVDGRDYRAKVAKVYPQVTNGTFKVDLYFDGAAPAGIHVGQAIDLKVELGGAVARRDAAQRALLPGHRRQLGLRAGCRTAATPSAAMCGWAGAIPTMSKWWTG